MGKQKYKITGKTDLARIERMAKRGCSLNSIARAVGVSGSTLLRIRRDDPAVDAAIEAGRGELESELVGVLYKAATRAKQPYLPAAFFLLKGMFGWRDQGPDAQGGTNVQVNVQLPAPLAPDDYHKLVTVADSKRLTLDEAQADAAKERKSSHVERS